MAKVTVKLDRYQQNHHVPKSFSFYVEDGLSNIEIVHRARKELEERGLKGVYAEVYVNGRLIGVVGGVTL